MTIRFCLIRCSFSSFSFPYITRTNKETAEKKTDCLYSAWTCEEDVALDIVCQKECDAKNVDFYNDKSRICYICSNL